MRACTFIGHGDCTDAIQDSLFATIEQLIIHEKVSVFYVGTHGNFDRLAYDALCRLETIYPIKTIVVLAYLDRDHDRTYPTHKTLFPPILDITPKRYAIIKRNQYMIDNSQYCICYINHTFSNSYQFARYATNKDLKIIHLGKYRPA